MNLKLLSALGVLVLGGCASIPTGPSREAFPGRAKSFEQFQLDDAACREYASVQTGGKSSADRANESAVGTAVAGTALGAAAGALMGGHSGAGVGAGVGLLAGSAIGSGTAQGAYYSTQRRYDGAYYQCMYAKGNKVPVYGRYAQSAQPRRSSTPAASAPPPPNAPPPTVAKPPEDLPPEAIPPPNAPPPR